MSTPDISQQAVYQGGNSVFDKVHILDELVYDFTKSGTLSINSVGVCTFTKVNTDQLEAVNSNITGISTVDGNFYLTGALLDSSGDTGTSGQILAATGSGTNWSAANTTSVANSINVGTNLNSTDADQFVTFVENSSGNNPIRVDAGLKYNPSTNRLTAGSYAGDGSALTGIESFVTGMIILWSGAADAIPSGFVLCDGNNSTPNLSGRFVVGYDASNSDYDVNDTGGSESVTLTVNQIPAHTHNINLAVRAFYQEPRNFGVGTDGSANNSEDTGSTGGGQSHENRPPFYALCYIMKT